MSNQTHTLELDKNIELIITKVQFLDAGQPGRENLNLTCEAPDADGDPEKTVYIRMLTLVEKLNGIYDSIARSFPLFNKATAGMSAQKVRETVGMALRNTETDPWGMTGARIRARIVAGRPYTVNGEERVSDIVFLNGVVDDNLSDDDFLDLLKSTSLFAKPDEDKEIEEPSEVF